jgi:hypothetical protein
MLKLEDPAMMDHYVHKLILKWVLFIWKAMRRPMPRGFEERCGIVFAVYTALSMGRVILFGLLHFCGRHFFRETHSHGIFVHFIMEGVVLNISGLVFILNALIHKKLVQFEFYLLFLLYNFITYVVVEESLHSIIGERSIGQSCIYAATASLILEFFVSLYLISRYRGDFNWSYFKRFGASTELKEAYRRREQYLAFVKIMLVNFVRDLLSLMVRLPPDKYFFGYGMLLVQAMVIYLTVLLIRVDFMREDRAVRKALVATYIFNLILETVMRFTVNTFVAVSGNYLVRFYADFVNETLVLSAVICLSIIDYRNFGMGLSIEYRRRMRFDK